MRILALALSVPALASLADAQCTPDWQPGHQANGLSGVGKAVAVFDDGGGPRLCVGGQLFAAGVAAVHDVAALANGGWSALGAGLDSASSFDEVRALLRYDDGSGSKLYAGGTFTRSGAAGALNVARWDGLQWSQVGAGLAMQVYALASFDDGSGPALYAGGWSPSGSATILARWNGSSWTALAQAPYSEIDALEVFDDGAGPALYAAGNLDLGGGIVDGVARWNGSGWGRLGSGLSGSFGGAFALHAFDDGTGSALYVAGIFHQAGATPAAYIARWNGTSWSSLGSGLGQGSHPSALAHYDSGSGPKLYVGGDLGLAGGVPVASIACWNGSAWSALGSGTDGQIRALGLHDDGSGLALYAIGGFDHAGGAPAHGIARWNGNAWSNPDSTPDASANYAVRALATHDDGTGEALYAAGTIHGEPARFDGSSWTSLAGGVQGDILALASYDDGGGRALFAGGLFGHAGGQPAANVARWNGTSWFALGSGIDGTVECFLPYDDGSGMQLYAAGAFSQAGGVPAAHVARWNGASWSSVGAGIPWLYSVLSLAAFDDGSGMKLWALTESGQDVYRWNGASWTQASLGLNGGANVLCVFDDGHGPRLYVGGSVKRWDATYGWQQIGPGFTGAIHSLAVFDDGGGPALYAGGDSAAPDWNTAALARWDGRGWSSVGARISGNGPGITSMAVAQPGASATPSLFLGGHFSAAGDLASASLAEWRGCGAIGTPCCLGDLASSGCPCANVGGWRHGCQNSATSGGARLRARGTTQPDTLQLESTGELATALSIVLQGDALVAPLVFGDGARCVGGTLKRLYAHNAVGGTLLVPAPGDLPVSARSAALGDPIAPGSMRAYQVYYRDPSSSFCAAPAGNTWNVSSGVRIGW
jgi:hypothetical protein